METIKVNLVTMDTVDRPLQVIISRNLSLKNFMYLAEDLLKIEIYTLFVKDQRLTDIGQLKDGDTILALNGLSPQVPNNGFFRQSETYESFTSYPYEESTEVKLVVLGPQGAGKTSLILRFVLGFFKTNDSRTLVEAEYEKKLQFNGQNVIMSILDTAGELEDEKLTRSWLPKKNAYILTLGIDQLDEWPLILHYHRSIRKFVRNPNIFVLITKVDLNEKMNKYQKNEVQLKIGQIESYCKDQHLLMFKTSAKVNKKVHEMFLSVLNRCLNPEKDISIKADQDSDQKLPFVFKMMEKVGEVCDKCLARFSNGI